MKLRGERGIDAVYGAFVPSADGGLNSPIADSSAFAFDDPEQMQRFIAGEVPDRYIYARHLTPTTAHLGRLLAALEGTESAYVTASGMAAISTVILHLCSAGDEIIASRGCYGGTYALFSNLLPRLGITTCWVNLEDLDSVAAAVSSRTTLIFCESISNPLLDVPDLPSLAKIARAAGAQLLVDNTFAPTIIAPAEHGADIVLHSLTKYINGMGDGLGGAICARQSFIDGLLDIKQGTSLMLGAVLDSGRAASIAKNLHTLHVRMERHCDNALLLAERLHDAGMMVRYPGLRSHPHFDRLSVMSNGRPGAGGILTVDAGDSRGANEFAVRLQDAGAGVVSVSLGHFRTLVTLPGSSTSSELSDREKNELRIGEGLIRVAVGLDPSIERTAATMAQIAHECGFPAAADGMAAR